MSVIYHARLILANGYQVVPQDSKGVAVVKWQGKTFTEDDAELWEEKYTGASTLALHCGVNGLASLDVDVDHKHITAELMQHLIDLCGKENVILRKRPSSPRFAAFFRFESEQGVSNWSAKKYKDGDKKLQSVNLNNNGLMSICGTHRKTGEKYVTTKFVNPLATPIDELALLTESDIEEFFDHFERLAPSSWVSQGRRSMSKVRSSSGNDFDDIEEAGYKQNPEDIDTMLREADVDDYAQWYSVGMAIHDFYNGSMEGFHIWDEWSQTSTKYPGTDGNLGTQKKWESFTSGKGMTAGVFVHRTKKVKREKIIVDKRKALDLKVNLVDLAISGQTEERSAEDREATAWDEFNRMIAQLVRIQMSEMVVDLSKHGQEAVLSESSIRKSYLSRQVTVEEMTPVTRKVAEKKKNIYDLWLGDERHMEVYDTVYVPNHPKVITNMRSIDREKQKAYYNVYCPPFNKIVNDKDKLHYFIDHIKYIFPKNGHVWFLNWLAQIVQEPDVRHRCAPLSICIHQRTGRGWLNKVLFALLGTSNVSTLSKVSDTTKSGLKNGWMDNKVLCIVNEVKIKGGKESSYEVLEQLKTYLSDDIQDVDVKWGKHTYNQRIYTRLLFCSNHVAGMPIDESDTRIQPFINWERPKSYEYYAELHSLLTPECDFIDQVYSYLMTYPVDASLLIKTINTEDRDYVIKSSKNDTAKAFLDFKITVGKDAAFTVGMLRDFADDHIQIQSDDSMACINGKQFNWLVKELSQTQRPLGEEVGLSNVMSFGDLSGLTRDEILSKVEDTRKILAGRLSVLRRVAEHEDDFT